VDWAYIEKGGQQHNSGEWNAEKQQRLDELVRYGHKPSFYCLDGFTDDENQGWEHGYNFGSLKAAELRWKASIKSRADFISTDQYELLAQEIHVSH
jgi:hypothetical protein